MKASNLGPITKLVELHHLYKMVAIVLWVLSTIATQTLAGQLIGGDASYVALAAQAVFTLLELRALHGKPDVVSGSALALDVATTAAGAYFILLNLAKTDLWRVAVDAFGVSGNPSKLVIVVLSVLVGIFLAIAPERVWRWK
jgi:hypothetical protein